MGKKEQPCSSCPHDRRQHSRNGCTERGCTCMKTYMQVGEENR